MKHTYIFIPSTRPAKWTRWLKRVEDLVIQHGARGRWGFFTIFSKSFLWSHMNVCIEQVILFFLKKGRYRTQGAGHTITLWELFAICQRPKTPLLWQRHVEQVNSGVSGTSQQCKSALLLTVGEGHTMFVSMHEWICMCNKNLGENCCLRRNTFLSYSCFLFTYIDL